MHSLKGVKKGHSSLIIGDILCSVYGNRGKIIDGKVQQKKLPQNKQIQKHMKNKWKNTFIPEKQ